MRDTTPSTASRLRKFSTVKRALMCVTVAVCLCPALSSYSVLTHEAIIDTAWDGKIKPLLLARFPNATPDDLRNAHVNAYGGCILQDMGY
jgi:hypothetical protein